MTYELQARLAERDVEISLEVAEGAVVAILGPNGAGKSTVLGITAGLLRPDQGRAALDGRVLFDVDEGSSSATVWVPPHERDVALLAQEPLLFPHLTVLDNVAFGPRCTGQSRGRSREIAEHWLEATDAAAYAQRKPAQLSGGQAQRVAVARALAADPKLLLLDEPMAALDVAVAPAVRQLLRRVLRDRTAIIVTHDILDALLLADRVVVVDGGHVVEEGPTSQIVTRPTSEFAARIAGLNMVRGVAEGHGVRASDGLLIEGHGEPVPEAGAQTVAVFRPSAVGVFLDPPGGSPRNVLPVTVEDLEPHGDLVRVRTSQLSADVTPSAVADLRLTPGRSVVFVVKASEVDLYSVQ